MTSGPSFHILQMPEFLKKVLKPEKTGKVMKFFALLVVMTFVFLGVEQSFAEQGTNVDSVTFIQHFDENTAHEAMQNDMFDIYYYPVFHSQTDGLQGIETFDSTDGIRYNLFVNPAETESQFNLFAHQEARYALNFLVDRDAIAGSLFEGHGQAINSSFGPNHPDYILVYRQLDALGIQYDPEAAEEMIGDVLAAEGATRAGGMWFMDGEPITIKMFIRSDDPIRESIGKSLAEELEELGLAVEIAAGDLEDAFGTVFGSDPADLGWHIYTGAWEPTTVTKNDDFSIGDFYAPWGSFMPGRGNPEYWNYENMFLDEITQRIYNANYENVEQRASLIRQATMEGVQESVRIFLNISNDRYIVKDDVRGVVNVPSYGITHRTTPINAQVEDGTLGIGVKYITQGAWNPVRGFEDAYSINIYDILHDPATTRDPFTGSLTPVRSTWEVSTAGPDGSIEIPSDAIGWDPGRQEWVSVETGSAARSAVTFDFEFSNWHNGVPMDINDVLYPTYLFTEWSSNDSDNAEDSRKYRESIAHGTAGMIEGIRILSPSSIQVYTDYWHFDDAEIAAKVTIWSTMPWEIYAAMEEVVLSGNRAFSNAGSVENDVPWLSLLESEDSDLIKAALEDFVSNDTVPAGLYDSSADQDSRYSSSIQWITERGNAVISNGPFYLDSYSPDTQTLVATAFDDATYPLEQGHWNYLAADRRALEGEVRIGSLAPVTGGASNYGADISEASALAVEHFNDYLERRDASWSLSVDRLDTATDPTTALQQLQVLEAAGIKIIDGPALDYEQSVLEYANDNDMLLVSCCSVTTQLAENDDSLFRIAPGHANHAEKLASIMHEEGITAVVPVGLDAMWINDLLTLAGASFMDIEQGNTVGQRISYGTDLADAAADLADAVKEQTDRYGTDSVAVLYVGFEQNVEFIKQASWQDILDDVRWFGAELNTVSPNVINDPVAGSFAERVGLTSIQPTVHDNQITKEIREHFANNDQFEMPPSVYANFEYDVIWLLGLSLLEAQSTDVYSVKEALADVSGQYVGASGNTALNAAGDRIDGQYATWKVIDGEWIEMVDIGGLVPISRADGAGVHRQIATEIAVSDFNQYLEENNATWRMGVKIKDVTELGYDGPVRAFDDEGIKFVSGPSASSGVREIKNYVDSNDMLIVSCCSTAPSLAIEGDNVFRLAADDSLHGPVIADLMLDEGKQVLISVWRDDDFGNGLHDSTAARFMEGGGAVDDLGAYQLCTGDGCYDSTFDTMTQQLSDKVQTYVDSHGSDKVAVLFVGIGESAEFFSRAADYPVLRTVQWIGSDANVLNNNFIDNTKVFEFLRDANFRSCIFDADSTSDAYQKLEMRLSSDPRIMGAPNVYTYASYDAVWILGLAMEAAGDAGFDEVKSQIPMVTADYHGALGNMTLNRAGDAAEASYAVWGIEPEGWKRIGTFVPDTGLVRTETVLGALLNIEGSVSDDSVRQRIMEIAVDDYNTQNPHTPLSLVVGDISTLRPYTAMQNIRHDLDDEGNYDALRGAIDAAIAEFDKSVESDPNSGAEAFFRSLTGKDSGDLPDVFVVSIETETVVAHVDSNVIGLPISALDDTINKTHDEVLAETAISPNREAWVQYMFVRDPSVGPQLTRSLLVEHDEYVFGAGYQPEKNGNSYFIGPTSSSPLALLKDYTDVYAQDTIIVSPSSTAQSLAVPDNIFRLAPADSHQVPVIISNLDGESKTQLLIMHRDGTWGNGILEAIKADYSGTIHAAIPYDIDSPDYASVAEELEKVLSAVLLSHDASNVAVAFIGFDTEFIELIKEIDDNPATTSFDVKWYGADGVATSNIITSDPVAGPIAARVGLTSTIFEVAANPVNADLSIRIEGEGLSVVQYSFETYDSVYLIGDAVTAADIQSVPVIDAIPDVAERSSGALGDYSLNDAGDLDRPLTYSTYKIVSLPDTTYAWQLQSATVSGTVFNDSDGDGVQDEGELGIEGYRMLAIDYVTLQITDVYTEDDGTYVFDNIRPAPANTLVQTWFYPPGTTVADPASSWFIYVAPDAGDTVTFDVGFYPVPADERVTLDILAYSDDNLNGQMDPGESGIEGLESFYVYTYTTGPVAYPVTDAAGRATVTDLVPADFALLAFVDNLAESGYIWANTTYEREDADEYDPTVPVADKPQPGSKHTMLLGLSPLP